MDKARLKRYLKGYCWLYFNQAEEPDMALRVQEQLEKLEKELRASGMTSDQLNLVLQKADNLVRSRVDKLTEKEELFRCRVIFGDQCQWRN